MAASNRPGPIHFVAIGLFMLCIVLGVVAFLSHRDYTEAVAREKAVQEELTTSNADRTTKADEIAELKKVVGFPSMSVVGINDTDNTETVLGAAQSSINQYGGSFAAPSFNETIISMREALNKLTSEKVKAAAEYQELNEKYSALETRHRGAEDIIDKKRRDAEEKLNQQITYANDEIAKRDKEIKKREEEIQSKNLEIAQITQELEGQIDDLKIETEKLANINDELRDKQSKESKLSFQIPDGKITRVDHEVGLVWLNLGRIDGLKPRTMFSVYDNDNQSVGSDVTDIKGTIEVVRIIGPHEAEARIVSDDPRRPIFQDDFVYTPLWEVGQVNRFSFVGLIDIDGDKLSDRGKLHDIIANTGSIIDNEVDDNGVSTGEGLTVDTRFLVLGRIPDVKEVLENEKAAIIEMQRLKVEYIKQARLNAVPIINLNEFLDFIGYHPSRRVWSPGSDSPFYLELGKRNSSTTLYNRKVPLDDDVTGAYGTKKRTVNTSNSKQDKIFRGTRGK